MRRAEPNIEETRLAITRMIEEGTRASEIIARTRRMALKGQGARAEIDINQMIEESVEITRRRTAGLGARLAAKVQYVLNFRAKLSIY